MEMHVASRRVFCTRARFPFRVWGKSRPALWCVGRCWYGCAHCRRRVHQHQPDARLFRSCCDNLRHIRSVFPRTAPRELRQYELLIQIRGDHLLQPVRPRQRFLPIVVHLPQKERAHHALRLTCGVHREAGSLPPFRQRAMQSAHFSPTAWSMVWLSRR